MVWLPKAMTLGHWLKSESCVLCSKNEGDMTYHQRLDKTAECIDSTLTFVKRVAFMLMDVAAYLSLIYVVAKGAISLR
jgi:hypothetical protein